LGSSSVGDNDHYKEVKESSKSSSEAGTGRASKAVGEALNAARGASE